MSTTDDNNKTPQYIDFSKTSETEESSLVVENIIVPDEVVTQKDQPEIDVKEDDLIPNDEPVLSYGDADDFVENPIDQAAEKSEEELLKAAGIILKSVDQSDVDWGRLGIVVPGTTDVDTLTNQYRKVMLDAMTNKTIEKEALDPGSNASVFTDAFGFQTQHRVHADEQMRRIKDSLPENENLTDIFQNDMGGLHNALNQTVPRRFGNSLIGKEADVSFTILSGGIRRVWLWNSGFFVYLRPMDLASLHAYYLESQVENYEHGKMYGVPYYYYGDYDIKRHFMTKVLPKVICGSNYSHWNDIERLLGAISYNDFDLLVLQCAYMLNPEGSPTSFTCSNEKCNHVEQHLSDLSKLQLINTKMITSDALGLLNDRSGKKFNDQDVQLYQKALNLVDEYSVSISDLGSKTEWVFHRRVPSMAEYLTIGEDLIKILLNATHSSDEEGINSAYRYSQLLLFLPWFSKISSRFAETTKPYEVQNVVENREAITNVLNRLMMSSQSKNFVEEMKKYAYDTRISQLAYYYPVCPKCGTTPKDSIDGYIPFDPIRSFFTLAVRSLNLHG